MWEGEGPWHIFHFIGHGGFDARRDEGVLALADERGQANLLSASQLARLLTSHRSLRLVLLNACQGGKGSSRDLFSSTAATLARRGIPAVLAMQEEITDGAAIQLTRTFYRALARGQPVDAALSAARTAISLSTAQTLEWGTPILYLRFPDGLLFDMTARPIPRPKQDTPTSEPTPVVPTPATTRAAEQETPPPNPVEAKSNPSPASSPASTQAAAPVVTPPLPTPLPQAPREPTAVPARTASVSGTAAMPKRNYPLVLGIDLGTNFSSTAYVNDEGKLVIVADTLGQTRMPTMIYFGEGSLSIGHLY